MENGNKEVNYLQLSKEFLDLTYPLATGPNKYKSKFGIILEGVFRKDYFTLQTIVHLANLAKSDNKLEIIFASSIVDLSRRVLEDMIYMQYVKEKGSARYSEQFIKFADVERKRDLDFLRKAGAVRDDQKHKIIDQKYLEVPRGLRDRKNWAGQSFEQILLWFAENKIIKDSERETILGLYTIGNRKNHTSSGDILGHNFSETLFGEASLNINTGLMITYGSIVKTVLLLIEDTEIEQELKDKIKAIWKKLVLLN